MSAEELFFLGLISEDLRLLKSVRINPEKSPLEKSEEFRLISIYSFPESALQNFNAEKLAKKAKDGEAFIKIYNEHAKRYANKKIRKRLEGEFGIRSSYKDLFYFLFTQGVEPQSIISKQRNNMLEYGRLQVASTKPYGMVPFDVLDGLNSQKLKVFLRVPEYIR